MSHQLTNPLPHRQQIPHPKQPNNETSKRLSLHRSILRIIMMAVVMVCGVNGAMADMPDPNTATRCGETNTPRTITNSYQLMLQNGVSINAWKYGNFSSILFTAFHELYYGDNGEYVGDENIPYFSEVYICPKHTSYCYVKDWSTYDWGRLNDSNFLINSQEGYDNKTTSYVIFEILTVVNGKPYISLMKYQLKWSNRTDGKIENSLTPNTLSVSTNQQFVPIAHSSTDNTNSITYSGPYTDQACTKQLSTSYYTKSSGAYSISTTGTYYFKASQDADATYGDASTVITVNVNNLVSNKLTASDVVTYVGSTKQIKVSYNRQSQASNSSTIYQTLYYDAACTTPVDADVATRGSQPDNDITNVDYQTWTWTFNKAGVYYMKATQADDATHGMKGATTTFKVTVNKYPATVQKISTVNSTIYRSRPDGLDVSKLFTSSDGGALNYALYNASGTQINLDGSSSNNTTLPATMAKGTYYIVCSQAETDTYYYGSEFVTLKIVGDYVRNITYSETSGTGTFSFDTHDMTAALGVTTPINVYTDGQTEMSKNSTALSPTANSSSNYRTYTTDGSLTLKMPNTSVWGFLTDKSYTVVVDARTEAQKSTITEMVTDYVVEYDRSGSNSYTASGYINSIVDRTSSPKKETPVDYLRYTVNITNLDPSGFWAVPSNFSKTGGEDIADDVADCPLTLGGDDTYGSAAKTIDDDDYVSSTAATEGHYFTHATTATGAATAGANLVPTAGTYYRFDPQYDNMYLTVGIFLPKRNRIMIIDSYGSTHTSRTDLGSGLEGWRDINGTVTLEVKAGHSYYFYSPDYPLQIFGYEYSKAE